MKLPCPLNCPCVVGDFCWRKIATQASRLVYHPWCSPTLTGSSALPAMILLCCAFPCLVTQSCLTLLTPRTVAQQAPLSMGFSRQECWSGLPFLTSGDLPDLGIKLASPKSPALAGGFFTTAPPEKPQGKYVPRSDVHSLSTYIVSVI